MPIHMLSSQFGTLTNTIATRMSTAFTGKQSLPQISARKVQHHHQEVHEKGTERGHEERQHEAQDDEHRLPGHLRRHLAAAHRHVHNHDEETVAVERNENLAGLAEDPTKPVLRANDDADVLARRARNSRLHIHVEAASAARLNIGTPPSQNTQTRLRATHANT